MSHEAAPLRPGMRLKSQVCATEIIVVRGATRPFALRCGGHLMIDRDTAPAPGLTPDPARSEGTQLGKRYTHPADPALEVLVTAGGIGSLTAGATPLVVKDAKPLPASD